MKKLKPLLKKVSSFILVLSIVMGVFGGNIFAATQNITSMVPTQGPIIDVGVTGGVGFTFPTFNGGATYDNIAADLALFVKKDNVWVSLDKNPGSGFIYDRNFGHFWDGGGGYWFNPINETTYIRLASIANPNVYVDYTLRVTKVVRNSYTVSSFDGTRTFTADTSGAIGLPLPKIDGGIAVSDEIDRFVYQIKKSGVWVDLANSSLSSFIYSANGYNNLSPADQWGYWVDHIYGLWFSPIQVNMELRIGFPISGQKGGDVGNNYVYYTFIGNPDAPRPDPAELGNIQIGTSTNSNISGWNLVWNDEFNGTSLDTSKWNYDTGYYLSNDPGTWGWGNEELAHYTNSPNNVFVQNGYLNLRGLQDPKAFPQNPNRIAPYSSGKITTRDKFTFKHGRIDFSAKLPTGNGMWPALWLLPNDNVYGTWAASGEIDVMEARGRTPGYTSGAVHFGDTWPGNRHIGGEQAFPEGQTFASDFHVYSAVWEADMIKWYVDGKCFYMATKEQWYSAAVPNNPYAPFDQEFFIIMNLAIGGWFDGGITPSPSDFPATMQVDYVRVYKEGDAVIVTPTEVNLNQTTATLTSVGETVTLTPTVSPSHATNKSVTWTSSNTSVATVDANGVVTAVAKGLATITVTTVDGNKIATCTVTVSIQDPVNEGVIEAENYTNMSGIQTEGCSEGGQNVGWTDAGDWMEYTVNVPQTGKYTVEYRVAGNGGQIQLQSNGQTLATTTITPTGDWQIWTSVNQTDVTLQAGTQTLRVYVGQGGFNLNWFKLTYSGSIPTEPITLEAENYALMSGIQTEGCSEGGENIGWTDAGDWMEYTVNIPQTGKYTVEYRVAGNGGQIQLQSNGQTLATTTISPTGDWQIWTSVNQTDVTLQAGTQTLRVYVGQGGFNLNWLRLTL